MINDIFTLFSVGDRSLLRDFDLSSSQYAVLLLLEVVKGWRLTDLSEHLRFDKSTVTRIIDRLEQANLVQRVADLHDRRAQRVILTAHGERWRDYVRVAHERALERRMSVLNLDEQRQLCTLLAKLRHGLRRDLAVYEPLDTRPAERG